MGRKGKRQSQLSVEARWRGELRACWLLAPGHSLTLGPDAKCDLLVAPSVAPQRRTWITSGPKGEVILDLPIDARVGSMVAKPGPYRRARWHVSQGERLTFDAEEQLEMVIDSWALTIRPISAPPRLRRRSASARKRAWLTAPALTALFFLAALGPIALVVPAEPRPKQSCCGVEPALQSVFGRDATVCAAVEEALGALIGHATFDESMIVRGDGRWGDGDCFPRFPLPEDAAGSIGLLAISDLDFDAELKLAEQRLRAASR